MKKLISTILCISLLSAVISIPVSATEDIVSSRNIESFCQDVNEMVHEYGDSEFVTPEFIDEEQIVEGTEEEIEINYCPRLIVQSDKPIDSYSAIDVVSGFSNFYILQFENEEDTNYAYEQYKNNPNIISVEYDISYNALQITSETSANTDDLSLTYEDYKNGWYIEATGINKVLEEYQNSNLPQIVIAVVDTGIDLNSKFLQNRIIPTGFNNAGDGDENSEQDYYCHGTLVSSVIANTTTDNVKIANYRCIKSDGSIESISLVCSAILKAINDGVHIVNCSFLISKNYAIIQEVIDYAYSLKCLIFTGAGNQTGNIGIRSASPLNTSDKVVCVGSHDKYNMPSWFTSFGEPVDILAPGEEMPLININDNIELVDGTSFSSPFMASVYAMYTVTHPTVSFENKIRLIKNCGSGTDEKFVTNLFGSGMVNVLELFELNTIPEPIFNLKEGKYIGKVSVELTSINDSQIYYTTDCTYPSPTNGYLYTQPFEFEDNELRIRAVAYKNGKRSNYVSEDICSVTLGTDDMFTINDDGVITKYTGNVKYLKIPEKINGITVTDIAHSSGFTTAEVYGVILPDTLEYLGATRGLYERTISNNEQVGPFNGNNYIQFLSGKNIKVIGSLGVSGSTSLAYVDFPNCEYIMYRAFRGSEIIGAEFPKVKAVGREAFQNTPYLREVYLPTCDRISYSAFESSPSLSLVYLPNVNYFEFKETDPSIIAYSIDSKDATQKLFTNNNELIYIDLPQMQTIGTSAFYKTPIKRLELSQVQYVYNLPNTLQQDYIGTELYYSYFSQYYLPITVELSLPSTLQYCVPTTDYKNEYIEYVVYGTTGTNSYAERWAKENDVEFINISQETAIVEDIESVWDKYSYEPLEFDARGFNRTYQWYGSYDDKIGNDTLLSGYTDKMFNPDDSKPYPYYYCVMTSTDKDIDGNVISEVTVTSSMCENRLYYMFALPNTHINFDNNLIYTKIKTCTNYSEIIGFKDTTNYYVIPSYVYRNNYWYGTSSEILLYTGNQRESYKLIVEGDINGDSAVDVLDAYTVSLVANSQANLSDEYFLAADMNMDEEITVEDYAQVVNAALAG